MVDHHPVVAGIGHYHGLIFDTDLKGPVQAAFRAPNGIFILAAGVEIILPQ